MTRIPDRRHMDERRIEDAIWKELIASTERRRLSTAQF
jgi:hypothetical protein